MMYLEQSHIMTPKLALIQVVVSPSRSVNEASHDSRVSEVSHINWSFLFHGQICWATEIVRAVQLHLITYFFVCRYHHQ